MNIEINSADELVIKSLRPISEAITYNKGRIIAISKPALLAHGIEFKPRILGAMNAEAKKARPGYHFVDEGGFFYKADSFLGWIPFPHIELKGLKFDDFWDGCGMIDLQDQTREYLKSIGEDGVVSDREHWIK